MAKFTGNAKKDQKMCLGIWIYSVWALLKKDYNLCALCNPICLGYFFYCSIRGGGSVCVYGVGWGGVGGQPATNFCRILLERSRKRQSTIFVFPNSPRFLNLLPFLTIASHPHPPGPSSAGGWSLKCVEIISEILFIYISSIIVSILSLFIQD